MNKEIFWVHEPIAPYLGRFYQNMKHWAFHMEIYMETMRVKLLQTALADGHTVISDHGEPKVFESLLHRMGILSDEDHETFKTMCGCLPAIHPDIIFYVTVSRETQKVRISERGRDEELPLLEYENHYLSKLEAEYRNYILGMQKLGVKVVNISNDDEHNSDRAAREIAFNLAKLDISKIKYISIVGGIGVGKSTICRQLVESFYKAKKLPLCEH